MQIVTPLQMKEIERISDKNGVSYSQLMDNAGFQLAEKIKDISENHGKKIFFLCGNGNNAGDCFVAIWHLMEYGFNISAGLLCGNPKSELAIKNYNIISEKIKFYTGSDDIKKQIDNADIICDGVFGTGFHGDLDGGVKEIFRYANEKNDKIRIAVDVPSGGNCLTGAVSDGIFNAHFTITFAFAKFGMMQYPLHDYCGEIIEVNIGVEEDVVRQAVDIPVYVTDNQFISERLKPRKNNCHKGNFGRLLNICGSTRMSGACMMAGKSALRCGVGILVTASSEKCTDRIALYIPEGMTIPLKSDNDGFILCDENYDMIIGEISKSSAVLIGCGLGVTDNTKMLVRKIIENADCPIIIDADGINCIADCIEIIKRAKHMPVLTPHPAEMARMMHCTTAQVQADRYNSAVSFAKEYNCIVALKGAGTVIASPDTVYVNMTGNSGMSRGGSGDVLAGMTASFYAQGFNALDSAVMAVYLHGMAGDMARDKFSECAMLPTDMIDLLGDVFKNLFGL